MATWDDVRKLFTDQDIKCMKNNDSYPVDLSDCKDVLAHAEDIYNAVKSGHMPKGGTKWGSDKVQLFHDWWKQDGDKCPKS